MTISKRVEKIEQDLERIERQTALKLPKELSALLSKNGYYQQVMLPMANGADVNDRVVLQVQELNDRLRITFEINGRFRVIQYDFYYE